MDLRQEAFIFVSGVLLGSALGLAFALGVWSATQPRVAVEVRP